MSEACWCDYDPPEFYDRREPTARKEHRCQECGGRILPGETYERVSGKWDGQFSQFKTCCRCTDLREWVKAHVPCFCWAHGNVREDALETAREYSHQAPGLLFGAYRREIFIKRVRQLRKELP